MIIKYDIVANPKRLTQEMKACGEKHRILYWPDFVKVELFDIRKIKNQIFDEVTNEFLSENVIYEKKQNEKYFENDKELIRIKWVEIDFDESVIENIINSHVPVLDPIIAELEELDKTIPRWGEDLLEGKQVYGKVAEAIARKKELRTKIKNV